MTTIQGPIVARDNFISNLAERCEDCLINGPPIKVPGQEFALVVVIGPENCAQRNVKFAEIILGVFETEAECNEHTEKLFKRGYEFFDIHVVPLYKCLPLPPNTKQEKVKFVDEELNQILGGYKRQEAFAQKALQDRIAEDRAIEKAAIAAATEEKNPAQQQPEQKHE